MQAFFKLVSLTAILVGSLQLLSAQDLRPRAYVITPIHSNAVIVGYAFNDGSIFFGTVLPITNASGQYSVPNSKYPPAEPEALRLLAPQRGLIATAEKQKQLQRHEAREATGFGKTKATAGGILPEFSKFDCLPGRAGGTPISLAAWTDAIHGSQRLLYNWGWQGHVTELGRISLTILERPTEEVTEGGRGLVLISFVKQYPREGDYGVCVCAVWVGHKRPEILRELGRGQATCATLL